MYPKHARLVLTGLVVILSTSCLQVRSCGLYVLRVVDSGTCRKYDPATFSPSGATDVFSTDDDRIFAYILLDTKEQTLVTYRWYREDELIYVSEDPAPATGYHFGWLGPAQGRRLPAGSYRVDMLIRSSLLASRTFRVELRGADDQT